MKQPILYLIAIAMTGCSTGATGQLEGSAIIAPGVLDLPVLPGNFIPDDCEFALGEVPESWLLGCVAFPRELAKEEGPLEWKYINELEDRGWIFTHGEANMLFVERTMEENECKQTLALVGWLLGDEVEIAKYGTIKETEIDWSKIPYEVIWFVMDEESSCTE